jgi:tetratricopeptide (TPR) repeat protein
MTTVATGNPFPGLRAFEPDEDHLFFGREREIDELLRRLRQTRFLCVVGASGSGKSSIVRSGLIPSLHSGFMVNAGSSWRVALLRPGEDPIGHLATALNHPDVLGSKRNSEGASTVLLEATLRRSSLGLSEAVRHARVPKYENLLVVIDQFEEIFRFRRSDSKTSTADAEMFVRLLLDAVRENDVSIYIVLTMRSDFVDDCLEYSGLPEAINAGQYLVPRMTRDELRAAITGPVAVAGTDITPRLVLRLLNDVGDDPDQLPVLQHALMRTWDYWQLHHQSGQPLDIGDYDAIGTMRQALSRHADEACEEAAAKTGNPIVSRVFKALTDTSTETRGVRRPTSVHDLAAICGCSEAEIMAVAEVFRRPGRSFLMPPSSVHLASDTIIDLSHESLMRCWSRLMGWAEEERLSATSYARVAQAAAWNAEGTAGLWRDPELELGLAWRRQNQPTAAWARRYNPDFQRAMDFLDRSENERNRALEQAERERKQKLRYAWSIAIVLAVMLAASLILGWIASREQKRAEANLQLAKRAVDEMLSSAGNDFARVAADVPPMEEFRRQLLQKAKDFYAQFTQQKPNREEFRAEMALAFFRLGDIQRLLQQDEDAIAEYQKAADEFNQLVKDYPGKPEYRRLLATTYNWLGETERPIVKYRADAEKAYQSALTIQQELHQQSPGNAVYQQELARTHYNRGILRTDQAGLSDESDFREAIRLLLPLAPNTALPNNAEIRQELARTYNNLARLLRRLGRNEEARRFFEGAIQIHESLSQEDGENREYKLELAMFYDNLAILLQEMGQLDQANQRNHLALDRLEALAQPLPSLGSQLAQAHNIRGRLLEDQKQLAGAEEEYEQSISLFEDVASHTLSSDFHLMFGQALFNLAALRQEKKDFLSSADLLERAVTEHLAASSTTDLGYDYLLLAQVQFDSGRPGEARATVENLSRLLPQLPESDRTALSDSYTSLRNRLK